MKLFNLHYACAILIFTNASALALPPEDDIPEEVLATEIIVEGRSNLDNQRLTASEYAIQQEQEDNSIFPPDVNSKAKHNIFLLQILKMLRTFSPIN